MKIVYWSSTGNTERMAQMLGEEIEKLGGSAEVEEVSSVSPSALEKETVFALGCSAMGDEELDEGEMEPFVQEVEKFASGKKSVFSVPMTGATASGCADGKPA